ncbi:subclass B1 metallo-beta-lactamase [Aquimarina longa]|uniref:subclass B1 metallo-beta-lactamase n=1 Tax=Aquimarina longa TaxID=1080221 RepID=UPI0030843834
MKNRVQLFSFLIGLLCFVSCKNTSHAEKIKVSEELLITKINESSYIHTSSLVLKNGATFPCNGFIYIEGTEAYIFDSPANNQATSELIDWLNNDLKISIQGVVFNHFHDDCIKGIAIFKEKGIPTIASQKTAELMLTENNNKPDLVFDKYLELKLGHKTIINTFFGEAHTVDNITSYFPDEKIIFGGCMIKSLSAKKGNLVDANLHQWSGTVSKIKEAYPKVKIIIPGHGNYGDISLLDYTISLFKTEQ